MQLRTPDIVKFFRFQFQKILSAQYKDQFVMLFR